MNKVKIATWNELEPLKPFSAMAANVDLVIIRWESEDNASVLYGRCQHRGALMSDGCIRGDDIVCGVHNWDYNYKTGISSYNNKERLHKFNAWVEEEAVWVDEDEIKVWETENPQAYNRDAYLGQHDDLHGMAWEPHTKEIQHLAKFGLSKSGHHGPMQAMGVPKPELPQWENIQILTAQLATLPRFDEEAVGTELVIGPSAKKTISDENTSIRVRYELWRIIQRSKNCYGQRRRNGWYRHLLG